MTTTSGRTRGVLTLTDDHLLRREVTGARVAVVTGSYGAGHDAAAREIAALFRRAGAEVEVHDVVDLLPLRLGRLLRRVYLSQLRRCPESWEATLTRLQPGTRAHRWTTRVLGAGSRGVLAATAGSDLVVSTHPFASQALGQLRHRGLLPCPVATYLTDASVHPLWVARGVDLHVAIHAVAAEEARALGGRTAVARPAVSSGAVGDVSRAELGLPVGPVLAVVVGGSLGIGDLEATADALLATGVTPVVMCGRDQALRRRLAPRDGVVALGWCEDVRRVFAVADVVVQNSGGFMTLEAMAVGVPMLTYAALPGHGRSNAAALERAGLVPWVRSADQLGPVLRDLLHGAGTTLPTAAPDLVELLTGVTGSPVARPVAQQVVQQVVS